MSRLGLVTGALRDILVPVGGLFLVVGTVLALTTVQAALEYRAAVELRGVVTGKELVRADRENNRSTRLVGAQLPGDLPGGTAIEAEENLPRETWEARAVGSEHGCCPCPRNARRCPPALSISLATSSWA